MSDHILVKSYTEEGFKTIPPLRLPTEEYARGLQSFVPACADIVPVNRVKKQIYLARRQQKPMVGWWWIGGKMEPYETKEETAVRKFRLETSLEVSPERFKLVAVFDYRWNDRTQEPQEYGCHMLAYTFMVELTDAEIAQVAANLEEKEYKRGEGLTAFDREALVKENVFPAILDFYDDIFK